MCSEQIVFAHRGLNRLAPENTMSAFRLAHQRGVKWLETDIDVLADGTVIICHDTSLDRTTNRAGGYYDLRVEDLAGIDTGRWFSPEFAGEPLPTLKDLVQFLNASEMNCNIELKANEAGAEMSMLLLDQLLAGLEELNSEREVIISSFSHVLLAKLHDRAPALPLGCLWTSQGLGADWKSVLEMVGASYIHPEDDGLTREQVSQFRQAGYGVNVWTVNRMDRANQLFNWGVTGIFTDFADEFLHLSGE